MHLAATDPICVPDVIDVLEYNRQAGLPSWWSVWEQTNNKHYMVGLHLKINQWLPKKITK